MTPTPERDVPNKDLKDLVAAMGITVTAEGRARARAKLDAAQARWSPEKRDALRRKLGLPTRET
jgi:hypothetical protein